jgi:hypothetical protein
MDEKSTSQNDSGEKLQGQEQQIPNAWDNKDAPSSETETASQAKPGSWSYFVSSSHPMLLMSDNRLTESRSAFSPTTMVLAGL